MICPIHGKPYRVGKKHCAGCETDLRHIREKRDKYPMVRSFILRPPRSKKACDACVAGRLRCDALAHNGAVLPCENADELDVRRMMELYGADGARRLLEVGNEDVTVG